LNEYNKVRERRPLVPLYRAYLKAWNAKIGPIFLTIVSSILGLLPFMVGGRREAFWFPLAAGVIGGLLMSLAGIFLYLPIFTLPRRRHERVI
jgi:multidrug efflux pump subunit AcrB